MTELLHPLGRPHMLIQGNPAFPNLIPHPTYSTLLHKKGIM